MSVSDISLGRDEHDGRFERNAFYTVEALNEEANADLLVPCQAESLTSPSLAEVRRVVDQIAQKLNNDNDPSYSNQYLLICNPSHSLFTSLQERRGVNTDAIFRVTTCEHLGKVLLRIMPSRQHDQVATSFNLAFGIRLDRMGLDMDGGNWAGAGSSRFCGRWCAKEADMSFIPGPDIGVQTPVQVWPSLVAEVGCSESLNHLRTDAQWWWVNSGHQTRVVVLFSIHRSPSPSVHIEVWTAQHVLPVQGPRTRQRSREIDESQTLVQTVPSAADPTALVLRCSQRLIVNSTTVSNGPLRIDFNSVMRRHPVANETDIILDDRALLNICHAVL